MHPPLKGRIQNLNLKSDRKERERMASKFDMKGFYRQKKNKNGGITKPTNSKSPFAITTKRSITPKQAAAIGSEFTHSPALNVYGSPNLQGKHFPLIIHLNYFPVFD